MTFMEAIKLPLRVGTPDECTVQVCLPRDLTRAELERLKAFLDAWALPEPGTEREGGE